jgi:hypothetical protein
MYQGPNQWLKKLRLDSLLDLSKDAANGPKVLLRVQTKTASYTVLPADSGTIFTTYGDTNAIVFTLPAVPTKGMFFLFFQSTDQNISVASAAADGIITFNDLDADAVTAVTGSGQIGALFLVFADGNIWNAACISNGTTLTVTT